MTVTTNRTDRNAMGQTIDGYVQPTRGAGVDSRLCSKGREFWGGGGAHVLVREFLADSGCCNCQCFLKMFLWRNFFRNLANFFFSPENNEGKLNYFRKKKEKIV
jgi:hypothetical protein